MLTLLTTIGARSDTLFVKDLVEKVGQRQLVPVASLARNRLRELALAVVFVAKTLHNRRMVSLSELLRAGIIIG